jgi:hypothetical protein
VPAAAGRRARPAAAAAEDIVTMTINKPLLFAHEAGTLVLPASEATSTLPTVLVTNADRVSSAGALNGSLLSGKTAIRVIPPPSAPNPAKVRFSIDGTVVATDASAPYDLIGGTASVATLFDSTLLPDGDHTMKVDLLNQAGSVVRTTTVAFVVENGPAARTVKWSRNADRSGARPLTGSTLPKNGTAYGFWDPGNGIAGVRVEFRIDGQLVDTDTAAPFDIGDGGTATRGVKLPASALTAGSHRMQVTIVQGQLTLVQDEARYSTK